MLEEAVEKNLGEIVALMKKTAPEVWAVAKRQAIVDAVVDLALSGAAFAVFLPLCLHFIAAGDVSQYGTPDGAMIAGCVFGAAAGISLVFLLMAMSLTTKTLLNPTYYAMDIVRDLIRA